MLYEDRFPSRKVPDALTFSDIHGTLQNTIKITEIEVDALNLNEVDPALSILNIGENLNISHLHVWKNLS